MADQAKKSVLIVDDDEDIRTFLQDVLEYALPNVDFDITFAEDGKKGIQKAHATKYDLILSDISMPNVNGLDFIRQAFWQSPNVSTPIIVISGHMHSFNDKLARQEFKNIQFIDKPVDEKSFARLVKMTLKVA